MAEFDEEDEEDPYSNIGLPPTTMAPTVPIVHQPVTVSNPLQRSSSVVMLSDDEQDTDEEQRANQYVQPIALQVHTSVKSTDNVPSTQAKTITPVPSTSNDPQLPQQVPKQQKVKKTLTDISRRFSKRILLKKLIDYIMKIKYLKVDQLKSLVLKLLGKEEDQRKMPQLKNSAV